ncbi:MAG: hypothetical protein WBE58_15685, partial [Verrucomicrobiales bacterium]
MLHPIGVGGGDYKRHSITRFFMLPGFFKHGEIAIKTADPSSDHYSRRGINPQRWLIFKLHPCLTGQVNT